MRIFVTILLSLIATAVMSYIAMATPIGPWIAPTLVLVASFFFRFISYKKDAAESIILVTIAGSVGGIVATALGFSLPTLYFVDQQLFNDWMADPIYFSALVAVVAFFGGWFGVWIANRIEYTILDQQQLPFPIAQLMYKMVVVSDQIKKISDLGIGFCFALLVSVLQDGVFGYTGIIGKAVTLIRPIQGIYFSLPGISFDVWPLLWAIGFVTGQMIAVPLLVAILSKVLFLDPIHSICFSGCTPVEFILAFCSGMVLVMAISGLAQIPELLYRGMQYLDNSDLERCDDTNGLSVSRLAVVETVFLFFGLFCLFLYLQFSLAAQVYLFFFSYLCAYQIAQIAGRIGLAQLGRFATFVMVPAMFLFTINSMQVVMIAVFVELCGGVCTDVLCGRRVAYLQGIERRTVYWYQYMGLVISSCVVGAIFWLLINHFGLGSAELFAQRAQARQLLMTVGLFDYRILLLGGFFGYGLSVVRINPMLVLGGLLMPINISLGLIIGGLGSMVVAEKEEWYPFWSGVFAANSLWMVLRAIM